MKRVDSILKWTYFLSLLLILSILIYIIPNNYYVENKVDVTYIGYYNKSMTAEQDIKNLAIEFINSRDSLNKDINTHLLEDLITEDQYVKKAEVYLDLTGTINIYVYFREPFVRLLRDNKIYHFDFEKVLLPSLSNVDKDLLIVSGFLDERNLDDMLFLSSIIYSHKFLNWFIGGVHYDKNTGYSLSSKIYDLEIRLGNDPVLDELKINMVKVFYTFLLKELNRNYCNSIDVQYDKQIICIN